MIFPGIYSNGVKPREWAPIPGEPGHARISVTGRIATFRFNLFFVPKPLRAASVETLYYSHPPASPSGHGTLERRCRRRRLIPTHPSKIGLANLT